MSQLAPTASGTLAATPLGHLLIYALDRRLTGSMVFEEPGHQKHALYFAAGAPLAARSAGVVAPLGELAVERGVLSPDRLDAALAAAREGGMRLGALLLDWAVLDGVALDALLREQVARRVRALAELPPETAYGYYEGTNFLERAGGPSEACEALPLIWRIMRETADQARAEETVARLGETPLRFQIDAPLARFELAPGEQAVVDVLRAKPQPLAELTQRELVQPPLLARLIYTLLLLRLFDTGTKSTPVGAERRSVTPAAPIPTALPSPPPDAPRARTFTPIGYAASASPFPAASPNPVTPAPARPTSGAEDALRREAEERTQATKQSYYEVLGVAQDAPVSAIASAYFQLAKRWHPDRLGPEHADLREAALKIFARIGEAHQVLSDADQRRQYDELVKTGDGDAEEQEQVQRILRATANFQKAQVMLKRNNLTGAEEAARSALADAPDEADHIALVAWLEALKPGAALDPLLKQLNRAAKMEEANLRVRWYRGQLLKRVGRDRQAIEDFRYIAEKDTRHVDAQREIRLFEMQRGKSAGSDAPGERRSDQVPQRRPSPAPAADKGGFFGKLFKK